MAAPSRILLGRRTHSSPGLEQLSSFVYLHCSRPSFSRIGATGSLPAALMGPKPQPVVPCGLVLTHASFRSK
ncbi:hypothetical protein WJX74_003421 [Apatococcus lobatus]|uniref:Uncharacterized protein n=1 Tax=Apatococcus lobatus TaxID=904363 RepID=A0AAW1RQ22_9CHLO